MTPITCPECDSEDIRFRHNGAVTLTMMPPIHAQPAYCAVCGCEWSENSQTWDDVGDYNPNVPHRNRSTTHRWQQVGKHGDQWRTTQ